MDELYLDNIDEYVNDHNKIVTYKWLSLTLGVHVNTAKQMLYHYLDHKRKESGAQLHATYLVSGKFVDNGQTSHKVSVVREEQLEDFKSKMNLVVSVHVYSVQKALLKDSGPLYSVDYDAVRENLKTCSRYSAIRCPSAVPMSSLELQQVREQQQISTSHHENKKPTTNGDASLTSKPSTKAPKGIMGMFSNKPAQKNHDGSAEVKMKEDSGKTVCFLLQQDCTGGKVRKRRRVLKSRTFVDDEGCIVTEKGYESESYSEAEDDVQTSKQTPKAPTPPKVSNKEEEKKSQKKSNASKGTKQASIMGFFQKK
uniref:DNA polymerase delta subunit 3 n=1 Tax=Sphaeramia orbicularis TaxID=375764 RepID=A0A673A7D7_9TELE